MFRQGALRIALTGLSIVAVGAAHGQMTAGGTNFLIRGGTAHVYVAESAASLAPIDSMSGGYQGMLYAVRRDGSVLGWGYLGMEILHELPKTQAMASSDNFVVALLASGKLISQNSDGGTPPIPPDTAIMNGVSGIGAGDNFGIALGFDGKVYPWGHAAPATPIGLPYLTKISAGGGHVLALDYAGNIYSWGSNFYGESTVPGAVTTATAVSAGKYHSLAILPDGSVAAWGSATGGATFVPWEFDPGNAAHSVAISVAAGDGFSLALRADGTIAQWGDSTLGQNLVPTVSVPSTAASRFVKIYAGSGGQCLAIRGNGTLVGWANTTIPSMRFTTKVGTGLGTILSMNNVGTISATGFMSNALNPFKNDLTALNGLMYAKQYSVTANRAIVLLQSGATVGAGSDDAGMLSTLATLPPMKEIAQGENHGVGITTSNAAIGWGTNLFGESTPPAGAYSHVSAGILFSVGLRTNGTVAAWGVGTQGQTAVPVGLNHVRAIACGDLHTLALKTDGTVVAWGQNHFGQCDVPAGLNHVVAIAASGFNSLALKDDGSWVGWGDATGYGGTGTYAIDAGRNSYGSFTELATVSAYEFYANGWTVDVGGTRNLRVMLRNPAPVGGATVSLFTDNPHVTIPSTVTIPAGSIAADVPAVTDPSVLTTETAGFKAIYQGDVKRTVLTLVPPKIVSIVAPSTIYGLSSATARINIAKPAPAGGFTIHLSRDNINLNIPAADVTIPAGATYVDFPISANNPFSPVLSAHILGFGGESSVGSNSIRINVNSVSITFAPMQVHGGTSIVEHIHYSHTINQDQAFSQHSFDTVLHAPDFFTVPAGSQNLDIVLTTDGVATTHTVGFNVEGPNYSHYFTLRVIH